MKIYRCLFGVAFCFASVGAVEAITISNAGFTVNPVVNQTLLPNGTTLQFDITSAANVEVAILKVQDATDAGTQVATISKAVIQGAGQQIYWNALWLLGGDLGRQSGSYRFVMTASTPSETTVQYTVPTLLTLNSLDIHEVAVTPTTDANGSPAFPYLITYKLAKPAKVTVRVKDATNSVIRTLLDNQARADESVTTNSLSWNGLDDEGRPVPVDLYTVTVAANDAPASSDTATERTRSVAVPSLAGVGVDPQKLFEDNVFVFPNPVRSSFGGTFQFQAIRNNATIQLRIYTISGDLVFERSFPNLVAGNITTYNWNLTNQSGRGVGRGLYYYVVQEESPEGTLQTTKKMAVLP